MISRFIVPIRGRKMGDGVNEAGGISGVIKSNAADAPMEGECDPHFTGVADQFRDNFSRASQSKASLNEIGAAITVYAGGRRVVELWGGYRDAELTQLWQRDTPVCVFSCTKGIVSILAMRLVQAGLLDYDARVVEYWPEYGRYGKEHTLVKHLLSHQAGLPALNTVMELGEVWRWPSVCDALSNSTVQWKPGSRHGYHALTWGYLVGAVLERAGGAPLDALLQREVCDVLPARFDFGLASSQVLNAANLISAAPELEKNTLNQLTKLDSSLLLTTPSANSEHWRNACIPAANGHCSASNLATIYQGFLLEGETFLSSEIIERATATQAEGHDTVLGLQSAYGMGFQLPTDDLTPGSHVSDRCIGHKGMYGSTGFFDAENGLAVGYVMNHCGDPRGDERVQRLLASVYECL